jgi:RHS repeat-associated protein
VRVTYDYYPFGLTWENPKLPGTEEGLHDHTYQDKEFQFAEFSDGRGLELHDFHARMYDATTGRWLVPDPAAQFANPYLAMGNNPVISVDPDGRFVVTAMIVGGLLLTDIGYDIQKTLSPWAVHINVDFGTHGNGIGLDVSVGVPQAFPINYRYDVGASYYINRVGGYASGWQVRNGTEWGIGLYGFQIQYGGMRYRDYNGDGLQADQIVHTLQIGNPLLNASYSNDTPKSFGLPLEKWVPIIPKLKEGSVPETDRYRTASGRLRIGLYEYGFFLHTGEGDVVRWVDTDGDGIKDTRAVTGGNIGDSRRSNGVFYMGFAGFNTGWDAEGIRHGLQNRLAHDGLSKRPQYGRRYPWMLRLNRDSRVVLQFGGF